MDMLHSGRVMLLNSLYSGAGRIHFLMCYVNDLEKKSDLLATI